METSESIFWLRLNTSCWISTAPIPRMVVGKEDVELRFHLSTCVPSSVYKPAPEKKCCYNNYNILAQLTKGKCLTKLRMMQKIGNILKTLTDREWELIDNKFMGLPSLNSNTSPATIFLAVKYHAESFGKTGTWMASMGITVRALISKRNQIILLETNNLWFFMWCCAEKKRRVFVTNLACMTRVTLVHEHVTNVCFMEFTIKHKARCCLRLVVCFRMGVVCALVFLVPLSAKAQSPPPLPRWVIRQHMTHQ